MTPTPSRGLWFALLMSAAAWCAGSASPAADPPQAVLDAERARIDAIARAVPAAIAVFEPGGSGGGSGVVISPDGYALSNFHVVKPAGPFMRCSMADGQLYEAVLVNIDPTGDVALIKLLGRDDFPHATLGDSDQVRAGDWCFAVGNPFLLATDFQPSVSYGIVSGVHRYQPPAGTILEYTDCIQTDAAINPGNSGGPLFDAEGRLIGINGRASFDKRGRVNVGVGYAISINQIKNFLGHLRSGRLVDHATLGATVATDDRGRVVVSNILENSDAYRRGLRFGAQLLSFAGRPVTTVNGFKNVLGIFPAGWRVPVTFRHEDQEREVYVRLSGVHTPEELRAKIQQAPDEPGPPPPAPAPKPPQDPQQPEPGETPGPRLPGPRLPRRVEPPPAHIAPLLDERPDFPNFHFNVLERDRVWQACAAHGTASDATGRWTLAGRLANGDPFEIVLGNDEITALWGSRRERLDPRLDLDQQLLPAGSGGLLPALYLWRRLLITGPAEFGETYYLGTAPLPGHSGLFDVLVGTHNVVEGHFSFDATSGQLAALEMFPDTQSDPCEIYFQDYRPAGERRLPHRLTVRWGEAVFAEMLVERFELTIP
jgi:S1-C subfamily serine protease